MLLLWNTLLFVAGCLAAAVHTRRQFDAAQFGNIDPELLASISPDGLIPLAPFLFGMETPKVKKSDKSWTLEPRFQKDAIRKLIRFGPFEVLGLPGPDVRNQS